MSEFERVQIESRAELRTWLATSQARTEGIWLVTFKKHVPDKYVPWQAVVEEALCYGWIDSRTRRVDEDRTMYLLSPRRPGSPWSRRNKQLVEKLLAEGRMQPPGLALIEQAKQDGSWTIYDEIEDLVIPDDLAAALAENEQAARHFHAFNDSSKKGHPVVDQVREAARDPPEEDRRDRRAGAAQRPRQLPRGAGLQAALEPKVRTRAWHT